MNVPEDGRRKGRRGTREKRHAGQGKSGARDTGIAARGTGRRMERSRAEGIGTGGASPPDGGNLRKIVRKVMPIPRDRLWYIGKNYDFCQTNHTENPKHHARHRSDIRQGKLREGTPEAGVPPGRAGTPRHALRTGEGTHTQAPPVPRRQPVQIPVLLSGTPLPVRVRRETGRIRRVRQRRQTPRAALLRARAIGMPAPVHGGRDLLPGPGADGRAPLQRGAQRPRIQRRHRRQSVRDVPARPGGEHGQVALRHARAVEKERPAGHRGRNLPDHIALRPLPVLRRHAEDTRPGGCSTR